MWCHNDVRAAVRAQREVVQFRRVGEPRELRRVAALGVDRDNQVQAPGCT